MFVGFGAAYSFAAFFTAFEAEFGASRGEIALVFSLCAFLWFSSGAPGGMLADRFGARRVAIAGVACLVAALWLASSAHRSACSTPPTASASASASAWSTCLRSARCSPGSAPTARSPPGIAVAGIGAGNFAGPPLAAWWIELFGWRGAYLALAAVRPGSGRRRCGRDPQQGTGKRGHRDGMPSARGAARPRRSGCCSSRSC